VAVYRVGRGNLPLPGIKGGCTPYPWKISSGYKSEKFLKLNKKHSLEKFLKTFRNFSWRNS